MLSIEKRLKNLELLNEAIANEYDLWGNTPEEWEVHFEILIAGGAIEEDIPDYSYTCPYIKIDGSICGKNCNRIEGCGDHWYRKNKGPGIPCKLCGKFTRIVNGYCYKHAGGYQYKRFKTHST
jgi:hypothetical protein